ncbi:beta-N-acetylhexosaminidase [Luteolibacter sp.]
MKHPAISIQPIVRPLLLLLTLTCSVPAADPLPLIPWPQSVKEGEGRYRFPEDVSISSPAELRNEASQLTRRLTTGLGRRIKAAAGGRIRLGISTALPPEGYRLVVDGKGISIEGRDPAGVFYGVQTLLQLMPPAVYASTTAAPVPVEIPYVTIGDAPAKEWRGVMLDSARHFMPKEFVLKLLDVMAVHKMNRFHWHLVDSEGWRLEIKKYPKLVQVGQDQPAWYPGEDPTDHSIKVNYHYGTFHGGGFYTQEDVREVVAYAAERHIVIMPEIEFPAHAMAMLTAYPEYSTTGKVPVAKSNHSPDLINVDEKSIAFLKDILDETMALFPGKWIHFGGDEAPKGQWQKSEFVQQRIKELGLKSENELQSWLFGQMAQHVAEKGRTAVGWEEITQGFLPDGAVVMPWLSMKTAATVANSGHPVILCPTGPLYLDSYQTTDPTDNQALYTGPFTLRSVYEFNCDLPEVEPAMRKNLLGAQAQLWTELMTKPEHVEYQAFPRVCALAETTWTSPEAKDFKAFQNRLAVHVKRLDQLQVNYRKLEPPAPVAWTPESISPADKRVVLEGRTRMDLVPGIYEAVPTYQAGAFGLWFDRMELVSEGKVIAEDVHRGFTGSNPQAQIYRLEVRENVSGATLRAQADSHEGTDSLGEVLFRRAK